MKWINDALREAESDGLLRTPETLDWVSPTIARLDGQPLTVFCSNDYLGLRLDPRLEAREIDGSVGAGSGASRLVSGNLAIHERAEAALASLVGAEAALLFPSGFAANVGVIPALAGEGDLILSDALNHASLIDGSRLSRARTIVFPHRDVAHVGRVLSEVRGYRRVWIVTESVFSMEGTRAPLKALAGLRTGRDDVHLLVDEAHALGVLGNGAGGCAEAGIRADVLVGTLGKALGGQGAFVAGDRPLRQYLWNRCRSFVFSTGVSPRLAGSALSSAGVVGRAGDLRAVLLRNGERLRCGLRDAGVVAGGEQGVPVVPVVVGGNERALRLSRALREDGFFVQAIRPPTVPRATARLRITVTAAHSDDQVDRFTASLAAAMRTVD